MRTITVPVCSRPFLFGKMLESLKKNCVQGFVLYVGIEPTPQTDEMVAIAEAIDWMETRIHVNSKKMGVDWNNYALLERVFSEGSQFNVHLEEDIIVAPDALDLARWYEQRAGREGDLFLGFMGHNYRSDQNRPLEVARTWYFTPIGWCCSVDSWNSFLKPNWMSDSRGWDWSIASAMERIGGRSLHPLLSRSTHTGREGGVHCSPEHHDRVFGNLTIGDRFYGDGFSVVGDWSSRA